MSDRFISDREHAVLMAAKRRSAKRANWILIAAAPIAGAAIISAVGWATRAAHGTSAVLYQSRHEFSYSRSTLDRLFRNSQGALCAKAVSTACVSPSGEVHIPAGEAKTSIETYFALRPHMQGASALSGWAYDRDDRDTTVIHTREVRGMLSAADVLTAMIEDTSLSWKEIDADNDKGALWLVLAPRLAGAQEREHGSP